MKCLCAISGIEFNVEHFPGVIDSKSNPITHPVFSLPQTKLLTYIPKWADGTALTSTDSYLLFLALLNSSDLVEFRVPVKRTALTDSLVAQNMEAMARITYKLTSISDPSAAFPAYSVSPDTCTLANIKYWIENWEESFSDFQAGNRKKDLSRELEVKEKVLERMILNPHKPISEYAKQLSDWARVAGNFPTYNTVSPFSSLPVTMSDYWCLILHKITKTESIYQVPKVDLEDLLEHCELNIPIGSIYSHHLFKLLRNALIKHKAFLGFDDQDLVSTSYTIISESSSTEAANLKNLIDLAPVNPPKRTEYPTNFAFFRAQMRFNAAKKSGK